MGGIKRIVELFTYVLMVIPTYIAKAVYSHYKRIVDNARVDKSDIRTLNAMRLAKKDLQRLIKFIENDGKPI